MQALHEAIKQIYEQAEGPIDNQVLYKKIREMGFEDEWQEVGREQQKKYNVLLRQVRWHQQTLKMNKLLVRTGRGSWQLKGTKAQPLHEIVADKAILAFSTDLGVAVWGRAELIAKEVIDEDVHLVLTSLIYPLANPRAYGNPHVTDWMDLVMGIIEPWVGKLAKGGSIVINLSNDIHLKRSPARSTYWLRFATAMEDNFGLYFMDLYPWVSNKLVNPTLYTCVNTQRVKNQTNTRMHLRTGYEPILWFTNDPWGVHSKNNRVLQPHTKEHKEFIDSGGSKKRRVIGDGDNVIREGSFGNQTVGAIPTNVLYFSNYCKSGRMTGDFADALGIVRHSAKWPESLTRFLIEFMTEPGQLVVDIMSGTLTVGESCELLNRRWVCCEIMHEYILQSFPRWARTGSNVYWNPFFTKMYEQMH